MPARGWRTKGLLTGHRFRPRLESPCSSAWPRASRIDQANARAAELRAAWDGVLERRGIAGYVYGVCSTFHVYFETDHQRVQKAHSRADLHTTKAERLKGMPGKLIAEYQRHLRFYGVDNMSSTGGVLSSAHTAQGHRGGDRSVCPRRLSRCWRKG